MLQHAAAAELRTVCRKLQVIVTRQISTSSASTEPRPATSLARDAPPHSGTRCHNGDPAVRECPSPHLNDQYLKVP